MKRLACVLFALIASTSYADNRYNQISLSSQVSQDIINDEMNATLTKEAQAPTAKALAKILNTTISQALTTAKKYPAVKVSTAQHSTYPRYNNAGKIIGFTGSVSLNLNSQNFDEASELMGELQSSMTIGGVNFGVSDEAHQKAQKELMQKAIARFQQEAHIVSHAFGAKDYKIVSVQLNHDRAYERPYHAIEVMSAKASDASAPQFQAGDSKVSYQVSGVIELVK